MADSAGGFSSALFVKVDGNPLEFYIAPGPEKARLKPLIEKGGGIVTSSFNDKCIRLVTVGGDSRKGQVPVSYVTDCIEENCLLPLKDYKPKNAGSSAKEGSSTVYMAASSTVCTKSGALRGRAAYRYEEDLAIYQYVQSHAGIYANTIGGRELWKQMEFDKVTSHTWQSMKDRYMKHIKGRFHPKRASVAIVTSSSKKDVVAESAGSCHSRDDSSPPNKMGRIQAIVESSDDENPEVSYCFSDSTQEIQRRRKRVKIVESDEDEMEEENILSTSFSSFEQELLETAAQTSQEEARRQMLQLQDNQSPDNSHFPETQLNDWLPEVESQWMLETAAQTSQEEARRQMLQLQDNQSPDNSHFPETQLNDWLPEVESQWIQHVEDMMKSENCSRKEVFHALYLMSGNRHDALHYLRHGCSRLGWLAWTNEEDSVLMSTDENAIRRLQRRRCQLDIHKRIAFLDSNHTAGLVFF